MSIKDVLRQSYYVRGQRKWRFQVAENPLSDAIECSLVIEEFHSAQQYVEVNSDIYITTNA